MSNIVLCLTEGCRSNRSSTLFPQTTLRYNLF